ncbi:hypothetical protein [Endothiovibrio diazotrophicus]
MNYNIYSLKGFTLLFFLCGMIFLARASTAAGFLGQPALPSGETSVTMELDTHWNDGGGARIQATVKVANQGEVEREGELRVVLMAINGRIDFDKVEIQLKPEDTEAPSEVQRGFYLISRLPVAAGTSQEFKFAIKLPEEVKRSTAPLQLFALYQSPSNAEEKWMSRDAKMLN